MRKSSISYIFKLSIPIFFANLAIPLVAIIDTSLMGNLGNISYLSATSVAANLFSMIFWSFGFLRMGTVGMVSQANGAQNHYEIVNIVLRNLLFVIILSITLIIFQNLILKISLNIFELNNETIIFFKNYFKIRIYSAPGELTLYIITGLFVGLQKTKISSIAVGFFSILNIILSVILVTKFNLNIKGVAYGTLFSGIISSTVFLFYTFFYLNKIAKINFKIIEIINLNKLKEIFNINFNIFIRTILLTFSFLWFTYLGSKIGEEYIAANAILINLVFLSAFILDAYAFSTEGIIGFSIGKKNKTEEYLHYHLIGTGCTMWVCWQIATLSGIILGSFVPEELGLKFAIPLTFIAIVIQDLKKIDHLIVMIVCGLSSLLFYDAPFRSYIIISPILALFVAALILRLKK